LGVREGDRLHTMERLFAFVFSCLSFGFVGAQESINAQEGFDAGKQVGIALAICFGVLAFIVFAVNAVKAKCVKKHTGH